MKYCKRCVMPDTRPGIVFDRGGYAVHVVPMKTVIE